MTRIIVHTNKRRLLFIWGRRFADINLFSVEFRYEFRYNIIETLKHLLPFSEYKIHTYDEIETILLENGLK